MVCSSCGQIADVEMEYLGDLTKSIGNSGGYEVQAYELVFKGCFPACGKMRRSQTEQKIIH